MHDEKQALHAGFDADPATRAVAVLEEPVAALEGAAGALATASGQAALYYAFANVATTHGSGAEQNIVSKPPCVAS
jgi:O-acetylhomoserine (thiol)-lyase